MNLSRYFLFTSFYKYSLLVPFLLIYLSIIQAMVRMKTFELRCKDSENQVVNHWKNVKGNNEDIKEL